MRVDRLCGHSAGGGARTWVVDWYCLAVHGQLCCDASGWREPPAGTAVPRLLVLLLREKRGLDIRELGRANISKI